MRRLWLAVAVAMVAGGCASIRQEAGYDSAFSRLPVLLVLDGDPLSTRGTARLASTLAAQIRHPVETTTESGVDRDALDRNLRERYGRVPSGGWASERCAIGAAAAQALAHDTFAHYRLVLRIRDGRVDGEVIATTFGHRPATTRHPIRAQGDSGDVVDIFTEAVAALEPPAYPLWDGLARVLLSRGCPLGALAVYDARLRQRPDSRDVLHAALGRPRPAPARTAPAVAATAAAVSTIPAPAVQPPSCRALCEVHMVELCNADRDLWTRHRAVWQPTPCGQRRVEGFLRECYERQWLTGTLQDACIAPCRRAPDGRARLLHLLQGEGCMRLPPS